ncbi:MAG: hypothetical protein JWL82_408 [Parcubacteria group bacterium]|nr:hypothetical protein [Parcubacteria group bacterium]
MDELTLDNKKYLSSKKAAKVTGYAKDYVGQLCREGRVEARLVGRNWYVLESSILEHRFGAEEKTDEAVSEPLQREPAWEAATYSSESVVQVPQISPKPMPTYLPPPVEEEVVPEAQPDTKKVLADMQSAWQEWFQTQEQNQEKALPEPSDMLLEQEYDDAPMPEAVPEPLESLPESEIAEAAPIQTYEPEQAMAVHIERIAPVEEPVHTYVVDEEPIAISRSYTRASSREVPLVPRQQIGRVRKQKRVVQRREGGNFALRAVFLSLAGLAIAITVIGSGFVDSFLETTSAGSIVTDFFAGIHTIK